MRYCTRNFVCERLRLSKWASYRVFRTKGIPLVLVSEVADMLNGCACGMPEVHDVPQLMTPEEAEMETGIPKALLVRWSRRKRDPLPSYRINKQTTRFRRERVAEWLRRKAGK